MFRMSFWQIVKLANEHLLFFQAEGNDRRSVCDRKRVLLISSARFFVLVENSGGNTKKDG